MKPNDYKGETVVTATEFKQNFGKYLNHAEEQNDVVITKNGKKVARLTPYVTDIEQYLTLRDRALDYQYGGKKVSYSEFMEIHEKSTLRMELINGEIYLLASPDIVHQELLGRLYLIFNEFFQGKKCNVFFAPFDVHFNKKGYKEPDVMQPDLLVACDLESSVTEKGATWHTGAGSGNTFRHYKNKGSGRQAEYLPAFGGPGVLDRRSETGKHHRLHLCRS